MCGRYTLTLPLSFVEDHFRLDRLDTEILERYVPRFNIAPGQDVLAIVGSLAPEAGPEGRRTRPAEAGTRSIIRKAGWFRWGLIPHWAQDEQIGYKLINARSETVAEKPAFRDAFRRRRCLIPADGFYEWKKEGTRKQPYRIHTGSLFAFAGLWEKWQPAGEERVVYSCTILTTQANGRVAPIHDRMPVILHPSDYDRWLDPHSPPDQLRALLVPYPEESMEAYPVSDAVNRPANEGPHLIRPVAPIRRTEVDDG